MDTFLKAAFTFISQEVAIDAGGWGDGDKVCSAVIKKDRKFVCIDYPGVIRNVDKAVATLGGLQDLTEVSVARLVFYSYFLFVKFTQ